VKLRTKTYAETPRDRIEYLLPGRIARGKLNGLVANGGVGKSFFTCCIAAGVTRGDLGGDLHGPARVLIANMEDGDGDTTRPRLEAHGADLALIDHLDHSTGETLLLPTDCGRLREHVHDTRCQLVILDPFASCLSPKISFAFDQSIRSAVIPLARLAEETGAAILIVHHTNGRMNTSAYRRLLGGTALTNILRAVYGLGVHPDDRGDPNGRRVLAAIKGNLDGMDRSSIECNMREGRLHLGDVVPITADELLCERITGSGSSRTAARRQEAVDFLVSELANTTAPSAEVEARARARGIALTTLDRARPLAGVRSERNGRGWAMRRDTQLTGAVPDAIAPPTPTPAAPTSAPPAERRQAPQHSDLSAAIDDASIRFSLLELDLQVSPSSGVLGSSNNAEHLSPRTPSPTTSADVVGSFDREDR
jgi:hypothetical protein